MTTNQSASTLASKYVISVESTTPLRSVIDHFIEGGVSFVVVLDSGSVAGVVSEHDVLQAIHDGADIDEIWAADIMTIDLVTAERSDSVADIAKLMVNNRIRHLVMPGDGGGVISVRNVLEALLGSPVESADGGPQTGAAELNSYVEFHLKAAISLASEQRSAEAASEAALALALLRLSTSAREQPVVDLPIPTRLNESNANPIISKTRALALQLQAHCLNCGQHNLAEHYESAAANLDAMLTELTEPKPAE